MFFFQAEDGIRDLVRSRGLGDVYKRQMVDEWFIKRGEKISGPFKLAKINAAMKEGKIRPLSLIHI